MLNLQSSPLLSQRLVRRFSVVLGLMLSMLLAACGGSDTSSSASDAASASSATASASGVKEITITPVGNEMRYEQTDFVVQPGQKVHLIFKNTATSPSMQHNVVVLTTNDDAAVRKVGEAGLTAGSTNNYVPDLPEVLANTPIAAPGETVEVTFTAPSEPGMYRYICTFPGHWATMQGTMRVAGDAS